MRATCSEIKKTNCFLESKKRRKSWVQLWLCLSHSSARSWYDVGIFMHITKEVCFCFDNLQWFLLRTHTSTYIVIVSHIYINSAQLSIRSRSYALVMDRVIFKVAFCSVLKYPKSKRWALKGKLNSTLKKWRKVHLSMAHFQNPCFWYLMCHYYHILAYVYYRYF